MNDNDRAFKGVWIEKAIYLARELNSTEKLLIAEIDSLDKGDGCFAENNYLANFFDTTSGTIANMISKLRKRNILIDVPRADGKRGLKVNSDIKMVLDGKPDVTVGNPAEEIPADDGIEYEVETKPGAEEINVSKKDMDSVNVIFAFWNSYKGDRWRSHRKITNDVIQAVIENIKHYSVEDICSAIANYAKVLLDDTYYWTHSWSLSTFLGVKYGISKNAYRKWYQFLPSNFIEENYRKYKVIKEDTPEIREYDKEAVEKLVKMYRRLINNKSFVPKKIEKFIEANNRMIAFFSKKDLSKENWIRYLEDCLYEAYINKGQFLYVGALCSDTTWDILMPQFISEMGIEE